MKNLGLNEQDLRKFTMYHKNLVREAVSIEPYWMFEYLITFKDGTKKIFDDLNDRLYVFNEELTEEDFKNELGRRIRKLMTIRRITQTELAKDVGVSQSTINQYVNGNIIPNFYVIKKISVALKCDVNDLIW